MSKANIFQRQELASFPARVWQESIGWVHFEARWEGDKLVVASSSYTFLRVGDDLDGYNVQTRQGEYGVWSYV